MIKVKVPCRMKWCYNPTRKEDGSCDKWCFYNTQEVPSPGDKIRAMNDEQLVQFLQRELRPCPPPYYEHYDCPPGLTNKCNECWLQWLSGKMKEY